MSKIIGYLIGIAACSYLTHAHAYFECLDNVSGESAQWAVGQHNHPVIPGYQLGNGTAACFVDGPELAYIKANFTGLHMSRNETVIFTGEDADFILSNL